MSTAPPKSCGRVRKISSTTCTGLTGSIGFPPVSMRKECPSPGTIASPAPRSRRDGHLRGSRTVSIPTPPKGQSTLSIPNMPVEYVRVEPPGIPTAFWRSVGPSHNVFVTESFIDELAAAAKQDPVAYRLALLDKNPRAKAVLALAAEKAGWGQPLPDRVGRGVSLQFVFATYMAQVAEVEVGKDGAVRVRRVVCAVDCGTVVNPDTVRAQIQSGIIFGITAALYGKITLKDGRVEQTNFDTYQILRMDQAPAIDVHIVQRARPGLRPSFRQSPTRSLRRSASACAR